VSDKNFQIWNVYDGADRCHCRLRSQMWLSAAQFWQWVLLLSRSMVSIVDKNDGSVCNSAVLVGYD
jgi:hypothetical protein